MSTAGSNSSNIHRLRDAGYELNNSVSLRHAALDADVKKYGALSTFRYLNLAHNLMIDCQAKEITATDLEYLKSKLISNSSYKFDVDPELDIRPGVNCLPQIVEEDWFDVEPILNKDTPHLINVVKPIGVNTIGSSLGRDYDIRGDLPNPKIWISPWLNSTIEPDTNIKDFNPI